MLRFQSVPSVSGRRKRSSFAAIALVLALSAALGAISARSARADDDQKKWKCNRDNDACISGDKTGCTADCGPQGCDCKASDPE